MTPCLHYQDRISMFVNNVRSTQQNHKARSGSACTRSRTLTKYNMPVTFVILGPLLNQHWHPCFYKIKKWALNMNKSIKSNASVFLPVYRIFPFHSCSEKVFVHLVSTLWQLYDGFLYVTKLFTYEGIIFQNQIIQFILNYLLFLW